MLRFACSLSRPRGFTAIELMVVIAIAAILAAFAGPPMAQFLQKNRISNAVNTFLSDFRFARSESIKRGGNVIMCGSSNTEANEPLCDTASSWSRGWIVFHDLNDNQIRDAGETLLRIQTPLSDIDQITENGDKTTTTFRFTGTGRVQAGSAGTITFGGDKFQDNQKRQIVINFVGHARVQAYAAD